MANYICAARSNYFRVVDVKKFREWCAHVSGLGVWDGEGEDSGRFAVYGDADGAWPCCVEDSEGELVDFDFIEELSKHLKKGSVAVLMEAGWEKLRFVIGLAIAVNSEGKTVVVDICDIYESAKTLGDDITRAEY